MWRPERSNLDSEVGDRASTSKAGRAERSRVGDSDCAGGAAKVDGLSFLLVTSSADMASLPGFD